MPQRMSPTMFKNASGVKIKGDVKSETINGNYIDESHTTVNETSVDREVYYQDDAIGVVNGGGRFSGVLNYTPGASPRPYRRHDVGDLRRQGYDQRSQGSVPSSSSRPSARQGYQDRPQSTGAYLRPHTPSTARTPHSAPSLFEGANDVSIEGGVTANTVLGDKYDRGTRTINRKHVPESHYHQEGAVGVINGNGEFSGTLHYGGAREDPRQGRGQGRDRYRSPYPDPDDTSSDEGHHSTTRARGHYRDQRNAVGVVNDNGNFSGTLNYNSPPNAYPGQRHGWDNSGPRGPPTAPPPPNGQDRDPHRYDQDDTPSIDVQSSSPENSDIDDIIGAYDQAPYPHSQAVYSGYRQGSPSRLAPPPKGAWDHSHRASYEQGFVHSPTPRMSSPSSQYAGGGQHSHPQPPRSPGLPPPYSGQPQGFQEGYEPWGHHSTGSAQGWHGSGLTAPMANMGLSPRQRVPYPSPPMSRVGQRPFPPEKGRDGYYYN